MSTFEQKAQNTISRVPFGLNEHFVIKEWIVSGLYLTNILFAGTGEGKDLLPENDISLEDFDESKAKLFTRYV